jgi:hypothetical protein
MYHFKKMGYLYFNDEKWVPSFTTPVSPTSLRGVSTRKVDLLTQP